MLFGQFGRRQLQRRALGAVVQYLGVEEARSVLVPRLAKSAQGYIGSKVRQAEMLRERAQAGERAFFTAMAVSVPPANGRSRHSRVAPVSLAGDLNAGRFAPDRRAVRAALHALPGARRIGAFCHIEAETTDSFQPHTAYLGLDGISSTSIDLTLGTIANAGVTGTSRKVRPGAVISKLRPYLNKAAYVPDNMSNVVSSTELLCVVPDDGINSAFVYGLLKLDTTVRQLNPVATGATHPRVDSDEVLDVLVPWHGGHEVLACSLEDAQDCYHAARALVTGARLLVEALIEHKVTEADLIAAAAEPAADRALLARLTNAGLDAVGEPLFPDLDVLFALLKPEAS